MALEQKDLELIERVIYKNGDDIAVSIGRSFERLEERIDAAESRIYSRLAALAGVFRCVRGGGTATPTPNPLPTASVSGCLPQGALMKIFVFS